MDPSQIIESVKTKDSSPSFVTTYSLNNIKNSYDEVGKLYTTQISIKDLTFTVINRMGYTKPYKDQVFIFKSNNLCNCNCKACILKLQLPTNTLLEIHMNRETKIVNLNLAFNQKVKKSNFEESNGRKIITNAICEGLVNCLPYVYRLSIPKEYSLVIGNLSKDESLLKETFFETKTGDEELSD